MYGIAIGSVMGVGDFLSYGSFHLTDDNYIVTCLLQIFQLKWSSLNKKLY